jgi:hypothetical protein
MHNPRHGEPTESIFPESPPAFEPDLVFHEQADGFRINAVLLL